MLQQLEHLHNQWRSFDENLRLQHFITYARANYVADAFLYSLPPDLALLSPPAPPPPRYPAL